ncbi:MAG: pentapeptide repeat-containing protein [Candidatus Contendobacter sp.]|nr:pentapeptide repeat-containing protein [Candidatus Contendobacter sp.]
MSNTSKDVLKEKLEHLRKEHAIASDAGIKFTLQKQIEEAEEALSKLEKPANESVVQKAKPSNNPENVKVTGIDGVINDAEHQADQELLEDGEEALSKQKGSVDESVVQKAKPSNNSENVAVTGIDGVINDAEHQADQELWSNVTLSHFSKIKSKVILVETPFHGEISGLEPISFNDFVTQFFRYEIDTKRNCLKWLPDTEATNMRTVPSIFFLTGNAGIGKTACLKIMTSRWNSDEGLGILPVYAPLTQVLEAAKKPQDQEDFEKCLDAYIRDKYTTINVEKFFYNTDDRFKDVILILDAFDEAALHPGQPRVTLLNSIKKYLELKKIIYSANGYEGKTDPKRQRTKLRGIILASRHRPSYTERQLLRGATTICLAAFIPEDVGSWLSIFNSRARTFPQQGGLCRRLEYDDFFCESSEYRGLKGVITTPLYLYLLACTCVVKSDAASDIVGNLNIPEDIDEQDQKVFRDAPFAIIGSFLNHVRKHDFLEVGAFNCAYGDLSQISLKKLDSEFVLSTLGRIAGQSDNQRVIFNEFNEVEGYKAEEVESWAIRALPLERIKKKEIIQWRFPHLSLVDFIQAERLVNQLSEHAVKHNAKGESNASSWWYNQVPEVHRVTIEASRMTMSDRAFDYIEQHLMTLDENTLDNISNLTLSWSNLNAVIIPKPSITDFDGNYIIAERQEDLGLRLANLGLPLYGCCLRARGASFEIGSIKKETTTSRYRLRQYLRLASFVLDSEFVNRSDISRLPLNSLKSLRSSMEGVDMKDVILEDGHLLDSDLQHAYLLGANLSGITIDKYCNLQDSSLVGVNLRDARLMEGLKLEGVSFYRADLSGATLYREEDNKRARTKRSSHIEGIYFSLCHLVNANLQGAILRGSVFDNCTMMSAQLQNAKMQDTKFKKSILIGANFDDADISGAKIEGGVWLETQFNRTKVEGAEFKNPFGFPEVWRKRLEASGAKFSE